MGSRKPLTWGGGVNLYADPRALPEGQLAYGKNAFPTLEGLLHKRESVQAIGDFYESLTGIAVQPIGLYVPDAITGYDFILHFHYGSAFTFEGLVAVQLDKPYGIIADLNKTYVDLQVVTAPPARPASFTNYRGRTIVLAAHNEGFYQFAPAAIGQPYKWVKASFSWEASAADGRPTAQHQSVPMAPRVAGAFRSRMVYANFGPGRGHWMVWADLNSTTHTNVTDTPLWAIVGDDALSDNGRHVEVDALVGEDICTVLEISLASVANPLQTGFLVLTEQGSAVIITGEPVQTTDSDFGDANGYLGTLPGNVNRVNYKCGGLGPGAICQTPYGTFWASSDDVWMIPADAPRPVRIGTNIRPALKSIPPKLRPYVSMAYADAALYLSIPTGNSTNERNMAIQHWRLDLYDGLPQSAIQARWHGPMDYESMGAWAGGGYNNGIVDPGLCPSLVVKKDGDRERVIGVVLAMDAHETARTVFVSFNEDNRAIDVPFKTVNTGLEWATGSDYARGDVVRPTAINSNGHLYIARNAGAPGAGEPTWPTGSGSTVVDGAITWEEIQGTTFWTRLVNFYGANAQHAISMDVKFKSDDWGNPSRQKLLRRVDINAYFATRAWSVFRAILNQGNLVGQLGPVALGDFTLLTTLIPAFPDLGTAELDLSSVATEFQSKTYRPNLTLAGGRSPEGGTAVFLGDTGVIRARHIQLNFCDLPGIVVDETNDQISWASFTVGAGYNNAFNASLTHGYYENMDELMTHIIAQMNAAQVGTLGGFTYAANPWGYDSAFVGAYPYMTTFSFAFTNRTVGRALTFIFGSAIQLTDVPEYTTFRGTTVYPGRTKRLLSILGLDISNVYGAALGFVDAYADGRDVHAVGENASLVVTPLRIYGIEVVPYQRPATVQIGSIEAEAAIQAGLPLDTDNR